MHIGTPQQQNTRTILTGALAATALANSHGRAGTMPGTVSLDGEFKPTNHCEEIEPVG